MTYTFHGTDIIIDFELLSHPATVPGTSIPLSQLAKHESRDSG